MTAADFFAPGHNEFMKGLHSFLNPEEGYQDAQTKLKEYFDMALKSGKSAQDILQPLINQGQSQYGRLNEQAENLNNPVNLENEWANAYTESPYAKQLTSEATSAGKDAASSMGLLGSSAALNNIQKSAGNIMQSDRSAFMDDLMKKYMSSIGIGQNLYGVGASATGAQSSEGIDLSKLIAGAGENFAGLKYGETASPGINFGKGIGAAANLGVNYATGGAS